MNLETRFYRQSFKGPIRRTLWNLYLLAVCTCGISYTGGHCDACGRKDNGDGEDG